MPEVENLLYDPQTLGGLLISVARESGEALVEDLRGNGVVARVNGEVGAYDGARIVVK